ncbi:SDR family oxidoreductase [Streptomyces sp. P38-E01]|uniref:SDR family oxidoreductase n=1 Tax=Streptomyces tardus TaxID=2780544 RepID=A0A949JLD4_9ACTN|nr:SDR family oxidoreductase [Streptomyces tardus]MBU7600870.1 SDR family oxidoreductase [Streptomyces tardus]
MTRQVTVVTGGGRGIGAAIAVRLGHEGHDLVIGYERDESAAESTVARVRELGRSAYAFRVDTGCEEEVESFFDRAVDALGAPTGFVNNAGITGPLGSFTHTPASTMRRVVEVNVLGALYCARRAAREMSRECGGQGGAMVNISSAAATLGGPDEYVHYAASKAAVDALTVGLAKELAQQGVRVNSVQPGMILTDIHAAMGDAQRPWRKSDRVPMGRPGEADEVAGAVAWLLSPDASYTSGAVLRVAGGL